MMSNVCRNCQQDRSANIYLCQACGAPDLEATRALSVELFIQTIESAGTFHAENQESRCVASYQKSVYTYSLGPQGGEVETVSFADRDALLAFLSERSVGGGYHEPKIDLFSGHLRQCRQGLDALNDRDVKTARDRFNTAINLGFYQAEIGVALAASVSGQPEEGRRALERLYSIYNHPQSGAVAQPLHHFFRAVGWVDAQRVGLNGEYSTWSGPKALSSLISWWSALISLGSAWSGEMFCRRGLAHLANNMIDQAESDLSAALPLLEEERDRVKHIVHPHFQGEHKHYGTLFAALSEIIEIVQLQLTQVRS